MSLNELYFFDNESNKHGSGSSSPGTFAFQYCSEKSVSSAGESIGSVSSICSGNFVPIEIDSIGNFVPLIVLLPRGVDSKGGRLVGVESKGG